MSHRKRERRERIRAAAQERSADFVMRLQMMGIPPEIAERSNTPKLRAQFAAIEKVRRKAMHLRREQERKARTLIEGSGVGAVRPQSVTDGVHAAIRKFRSSVE